jgi:hypothetical protein
VSAGRRQDKLFAVLDGMTCIGIAKSMMVEDIFIQGSNFKFVIDCSFNIIIHNFIFTHASYICQVDQFW